jgi:hypothetical protein
MEPPVNGDLDYCPVRRPGLVDVPVGGETIVVDEPAARLHHLDAAASSVWARLDGTVSLREIIAALASAHGAPTHQVESDVRALSRHLAELELLEPA